MAASPAEAPPSQYSFDYWAASDWGASTVEASTELFYENLVKEAGEATMALPPPNAPNYEMRLLGANVPLVHLEQKRAEKEETLARLEKAVAVMEKVAPDLKSSDNKMENLENTLTNLEKRLSGLDNAVRGISMQLSRVTNLISSALGRKKAAPPIPSLPGAAPALVPTGAIYESPLVAEVLAQEAMKKGKIRSIKTRAVRAAPLAPRT